MSAAQHGLFVFLEPPRRLAFPTRVDFSCLAAAVEPRKTIRRRKNNGERATATAASGTKALLSPVYTVPQRTRQQNRHETFWLLAQQ